MVQLIKDESQETKAVIILFHWTGVKVDWCICGGVTAIDASTVLGSSMVDMLGRQLQTSTFVTEIRFFALGPSNKSPASSSFLPVASVASTSASFYCDQE